MNVSQTIISVSRMSAMALVAVSSMAQSAEPVACPATHQGAPLLAMDGSSVYLGDPSGGRLQAPSGTGTNANGWWNTYDVRDSARYYMGCRYADKQAFAYHLPAGLSVCLQDAASMVCR